MERAQEQSASCRAEDLCRAWEVCSAENECGVGLFGRPARVGA